MVSKLASWEHAHQLAIRLQQLCFLEQTLRELQRARQMPHHVGQSEDVSAFSDTVVFSMLLSMLYSVFDEQSKAVNLKRLRTESAEFRAELSSVIKRWKMIEKPIVRVRNGFAFHGSASRDGTANALKSFEDLGSEGVSIAYRLIEDLRHIYPWLVLEAQGGYAIPEALNGKFKDILVARCAAHEAQIEARNNWDSGNSNDLLNVAVTHAKYAEDAWNAFRYELAREPSSGGLTAFLDVWDAQFIELRSTAESLSNLRRVVDSARETVRLTGMPDTVNAPRQQFENHLSAFLLMLPFWRSRLELDTDGEIVIESLQEAGGCLISLLRQPR